VDVLRGLDLFKISKGSEVPDYQRMITMMMMMTRSR
jgi:hypothetical protein